MITVYMMVVMAEFIVYVIGIITTVCLGLAYIGGFWWWIPTMFFAAATLPIILDGSAVVRVASPVQESDGEQ